MQVSRSFTVAFATILVSLAAFGQSAVDTTFQIHYFSNVPTTSTFVNISDSGASQGTTFVPNTSGPVLSNANGPCGPANPCSSSGPAVTVVGNGNLCVNAYVFNATEELVSCCSCFVTPNGLNSWSNASLVPTGVTSGVIKLVATLGGTPSSTGCNAALAGQSVNLGSSATNSVLAPGLVAWTRGQVTTTSSGVESAFAPSTLTTAELARLTTQCSFMTSTPGICSACTSGGQ